MSRFNNVQILLNLAEKYEQEPLVELLLDEDTPTEELAEDIAYVIISLWGMVPTYARKMFRERLTDDMVNLEMKAMFPEEELDD